MECYKSTAHLDCSEMFYKQCIEEELRAQQSDPKIRLKTLNILQKMYDEEVEDDVLTDILQDENNDVMELDSDDDNIQCLEKRLENINLDNANELWSALTAYEKQEFETLIASGEASKLLPLWNPWWTFSVSKKLIEEIDNTNNDQDYKNNCPQILNCSALKSISKVSPLIRFNIINTIYAYAFSVLYFNGEHHSSSFDAVYIFLQICDTLRVNRIFKDCSSAIEHVLLEIANNKILSGDQETILETKKAGDLILNGPEEKNKSFYVITALSDLHQLLYKVKTKISKKQPEPIDHEFNSKFQSSTDMKSIKISKTNISLFMKKIEFYITWLKSQSETYDITEGDKI
ncbi:PREDICTED: zinc finger HIT domain-containing protein 2 [Ceratosolen solmsi marchali]|uniref:Zinc finger HIT domain-containing protein 2 n=1 Tax=Ceratosolen solmsi marchali TaxID=326594 RepID=A0AAJ7DYK5_9HYME|nr:PREDICTED: zinc finger HIT domain-containing protein 2 [Ceratosolen solmsi marchali]